MVADRAYSPGFVASTDRGASLFYFAAALPAVGFVHGPADLYPLNAANARLLPTDRVHKSRAGSRYALPERSLGSAACRRVHRLLDAAVGRTVTLAQMRWVILDLGELPCLIDVSKLNPGPSGEDANAVGQPRDVGLPCASAR